MSARSHRLLGLVAVVVGGLVAAGASSMGCGGKTDDPGAADTGVTLLDSTAETAADTSTPADSEKTYDVPGSLFDAELPDIVFEGGKTARGCYDCTLDKCKAEVAECDKDPRCRGLLLCILTDCAGSLTDFSCALGCAGKFDVTGFGDPVVGKVQAVGNCNQKNCSHACPNIPDGGPGDAKPETAPDTTASDTTASDTTASDTASTDTATADATSDAKDGGGSSPSFSFAPPSMPAKAMSIDPRVVEVLQSVAASFADPELRQGMIDHLSH